MKKLNFALLLFVLVIGLKGFGSAQSDTTTPNERFQNEESSFAPIDSLRQLPVKLQVAIKSLFQRSMTDFVSNIKFIYGIEHDLANMSNYDSAQQLVNNGYKSIAKYELIFELKDTLLEENFQISLAFDANNRMVYFNWPSVGFNKRANIASYRQIKARAISYAKYKKYKTDGGVSSSLYYNNKTHRLEWQVFIYQDQISKYIGENTYPVYYEVYRAIIIDPKSTKVTGDSKMTRTLKED